MIDANDAIEVVVGLIVRNGSVLMGERKPNKVYPLHWEFPGGKVEPNESLENALRRELKEELLLEIDSLQPWEVELATYSNGITYRIHYFIVRPMGTEPTNLEFESIRWITHSELPTLLHLSGNSRVLARLQREGIPL